MKSNRIKSNRIESKIDSSSTITTNVRCQVGNFQASCGVFLICLVVVAWDGRHVLRRRADNKWRWCGRANAALWALAALYIDLFSGVLHIVLDNPHFVRWPLIGPQCESFQTHHASPTRLLTTPWFA